MGEASEGCKDLFGRELEGHVNKGFGVEEELGGLDSVEEITVTVDGMRARRESRWN